MAIGIQQHHQPGEAFLELNDLLQQDMVGFDLNEPFHVDDLGDIDENPDLVMPLNLELQNVNGIVVPEESLMQALILQMGTCQF